MLMAISAGSDIIKVPERKAHMLASLWSINGSKTRICHLCINETASGWQTVTLSTPVAITANTIYVVSYFSPNGDFVKTPQLFYN
jgi:hypothetical protein